MRKINPTAPMIVLSMALTATTVSAQSEDVETTFDDEWIMISGEVDTILPAGFTLDYGEDDIIVEMDTFDWDVGTSLVQDDRVTVTGRMDRSFYDARSIEASTVYIPRLSEYLYADPTDEEGDPTVTRSFAPGFFYRPDEGDWLSFSGRVTGAEGDEIMVDTGVSTFRVDTTPVPGNLVAPSVAEGDHVLVTGELDAADLFDKREVEADSVTKLSDLSY